MGSNIVDYIFLVKLIRGVLTASSPPSQEIVNWIKKSFRWRPVGFVPSVSSFFRGQGIRSSIMKKLVLPDDNLNKFVGLLHSKGLPQTISEGIVYSLTYIAPLIILDSNLTETITKSNISVLNIQTTKHMNTRFIKMHIRIAEYSMKDIYRQMIINTKNRLKKNIKFEKIIETRRKLIIKDSKRFWRINQQKGKIVISYLDPLLLIKQDELEKLLPSKPSFADLMLGHVVAIHLENMLHEEK